jgi:ATP-dependent Lon protease
VPGTASLLPMFPLSGVLFPHASMPLHVFEERYRELTRVCLEGDGRFGVVLIERGSEVGGGDQRSDAGTRGVITHAAALPDGRWAVRVQGEARIAVEKWLPDDPYPRALVTEWPALADDAATETVSDADSEALAPVLTDTEQRLRRARALVAEHGGVPALPPEEIFDTGDPETATWRLCAAAPVTAYDAQRLLVAEGTTARLGLLGRLMDDLELDLRRLHTPG